MNNNTKIRKAEITKVVDNDGAKIGYVQVKDELGDTHHFINGSINGISKDIANINSKGEVEYITGRSYSLWFWRPNSK